MARFEAASRAAPLTDGDGLQRLAEAHAVGENEAAPQRAAAPHACVPDEADCVHTGRMRRTLPMRRGRGRRPAHRA
eukprot:856991-Prymnesium_polylepis.2